MQAEVQRVRQKLVNLLFTVPDNPVYQRLIQFRYFLSQITLVFSHNLLYVHKHSRLLFSTLASVTRQ